MATQSKAKKPPAEKKASAPRLDIFETLGAINRKDTKWFGKLSPELQKSFSPYMVQRWMYGTSSPVVIEMLDAVVAPYTFTLRDHPALLYKLFVAASLGKNERYQWFAPKRKPVADVQAIMLYYNINARQAREAAEILSIEAIEAMYDELGLEKA